MDEDSPPPLDAPADEIDDHWTEDTTITLPRIVKASLDEHRDGKKWGPYLEELRRNYADPLTLNDAEEIAEYVTKQLDTIDLDVDEREIANMVASDLSGQLSAIEETVEELTGNNRY